MASKYHQDEEGGKYAEDYKESRFSVGDEVRVTRAESQRKCRATVSYVNDNRTIDIVYDCGYGVVEEEEEAGVPLDRLEKLQDFENGFDAAAGSNHQGLKGEGAALFKIKDFVAAYAKYIDCLASLQAGRNVPLEVGSTALVYNSALEKLRIAVISTVSEDGESADVMYDNSQTLGKMSYDAAARLRERQAAQAERRQAALRSNLQRPPDRSPKCLPSIYLLVERTSRCAYSR